VNDARRTAGKRKPILFCLIGGRRTISNLKRMIQNVKAGGMQWLVLFVFTEDQELCIYIVCKILWKPNSQRKRLSMDGGHTHEISHGVVFGPTIKDKL